MNEQIKSFEKRRVRTLENRYAEHVAKVLKEACKEVEMNAERYVADLPFITEFTLTIRVNADTDEVAIFPTIEAYTKSYPTNPDKYTRMRDAYFDSLKEDEING